MQVVKIPVVAQRPIPMVLTVQQTIEIPQFVFDVPVVQVVLAMPVVVHDRQFLHGLDVAVTRGDKFLAVQEVPQTRSSTGCLSGEEE